jgi:hypothetical protein
MGLSSFGCGDVKQPAKETNTIRIRSFNVFIYLNLFPSQAIQANGGYGHPLHGDSATCWYDFDFKHPTTDLRRVREGFWLSLN